MSRGLKNFGRRWTGVGGMYALRDKYIIVTISDDQKHNY